MDVCKNLEKNLQYLQEKLGIGQSFDVISRPLIIAGKNASLIFIDGLVKDEVMLRILEPILKIKKEDLRRDVIRTLIQSKIGYIEVESVSTLEEVIDNVLAGPVALLIDGETEAIIIDARQYPSRNPEEPDLERVTRGPRDGLVETVVFNTALIRRRLRDPNLRNEIIKVGARTKTDVVVSYLKDRCDQRLVDKIKSKIKEIKTDDLVMAEKSLEEFIVGSKWNPFPRARFTERPDVVAAHLLEGYVAVIVDTSPSVMILPAYFFNFVQHAEDYYQNPVIGSYIRWVRFMGLLISLILTPLWLVLALNKDALPSWLQFIGLKEPTPIPLFLQFLILELGVDLIRIALIHTPNALATSLGLLGAVMLGQFAVEIGLFSGETILYTAIAAIGTFAIPSIEFAQSIRLFRLIILILTGLFSWYGFLTGIFFMILVLIVYRAFDGTPYMWPLFPLNMEALRSILLRKPIPEVRSEHIIKYVKNGNNIK
ncbi:spore germination protein [Thermosediminibacter litoriperuensis]|uniref:Stage V sporulation protein AF n=1 Tax=Thermosediminibacter litoriperuensis TaxID=291989 RepID=A0A5S5AQG1_9FIRM|nr:spore germination protein [Thermosediminibacter litoriperuensis]TYP54270.1 stage V sporulation protein AF [Thermosediminibacter litoriperuensis]